MMQRLFTAAQLHRYVASSLGLGSIWSLPVCAHKPSHFNIEQQCGAISKAIVHIILS